MEKESTLNYITRLEYFPCLCNDKGQYPEKFVFYMLNELFLNELIKSGYITIEDNDIKNYYELFNNIMQEYSSEDIYTSIHYITSKIKLNKFRDEDGNEISNKFGYFNNALKSNLNKLEYMKSETDLYGDDLFDDILNVKSDNER